jgi:hypothetical protein
MKIALKTWLALSLLPQFLLVQWLGNHTAWVERYYSQGLYPHFSKFLRHLLGWLPLSVGDVCYTLLGIVAIRYLIVKRIYIKTFPLSFVRDVLMVCSIVYFSFYVLWGLNYFREPLRNKLELVETNDYDQLVIFTRQLIQKTNQLQASIAGDTIQGILVPYDKDEMFQKTIAGYDALSQRHPFLSLDVPSAKTSLYSTALSYMGYAGYLNPFTGEAQVNGLLPAFRFPVVAGHEMGHQLGYSAENETNFIGYLVTATNADPYFQYAGHAYALGYCLSDVRRGNPDMFQELMGELNQGVKANFTEMNAFWTLYQNPMEPVFKSVFNSFLKANKQAKGIQSYNAVVSLLVPYHQKYPL